MKINFFNESSLKTRIYEKLIKSVFKTINSKKEFNIIIKVNKIFSTVYLRENSLQ